VDPGSLSSLSPFPKSAPAVPPPDNKQSVLNADLSSDSEPTISRPKSQMASQSKMASVDQDAPFKVPILSSGDITPAVMHKFEDTCIGYFENKDIDDDKQVRKILAGLKDDCIKKWLSVDRLRFQSLSFDTFVIEFRVAYLPENWEQDTRSEVLSLSQGSQSFWDFVVTLQSKNALLTNTASAKSDREIGLEI
jgi:hypothetical protein